jgi:hypothetical protein
LLKHYEVLHEVLNVSDEFFCQEIEATVVDGNGTETGHIIATTIGGRNGQPKQVVIHLWNSVLMQ